MPPNSTRFARFWRHFAIMTRDLMAAGATGSVNRPKDLNDIASQKFHIKRLDSTDLGLRIAGHNSLRKMKPDTTLVLTNLSLGHFCITSLCRQAQMYLE